MLNPLERQSSRQWAIVLTITALLAGAGIGYVDSRPTWDDTGITVMALALTALAFSLARPRQWWLWSVLVGVGTPAFAVLSGGSPGTSIALVVALLGGRIGALAGTGFRTAMR